ncbi:uncharacterized protein CEXT_644011 [Caerostris extrusa]|uniref:C2H2-type domain-containing protein n=1 Tax=Caerostris extrusa TaxID=172846 RepID=A0AAV4TZE9_CAEEX|nr:uncharacterized protein CEXT_644011 [Caerostris extrusa]
MTLLMGFVCPQDVPQLFIVHFHDSKEFQSESFSSAFFTPRRKVLTNRKRSRSLSTFKLLTRIDCNFDYSLWLMKKLFFASSPKTEQIEIFKANKTKLERWFNTSQKDKTSGDNARGKRSKVVIEDSDSSQGESIQAKRPRIQETVQNSIDDAKPTILVQNEKTDAVKVIQPGQIIKVTRTIEVQPPVKTSDPVVQSASSADPVVQPVSRAASSSQEKILFSCASCQYQSYEENEFMKHTRADHRDLSMWCKECGKCFSNAGVLISHIKDKQCLIEDMIYRCGVKDCDFETDNGQTFVHHLRHCHKGSPFIFCVYCQKIFTLPHCLILHMQDECPHKERHRKNNGTVKTTPVQAPKKPTLPPVPVVISKPQTLTPTPKPITMVNYSVPRATTPSTVKTPPSSIGRGALMPTARGRARGRGRSRLPSYSSDSDDPDDPSWKPEEATGTQTLRRSGRWAKKVNDAVNVESSQTSKSLSMAELNNKEMLDCPCCDFMAAFKSVLQDHYIAQHKVPNKNACLVCHLKFEATQGFLDHFEDHANGKLSNKMVTDVEVIPSTSSKNNLKTYGKSNLSKNSCEASNSISIDKESIQGVVKNLSEINVVNSKSEQSQYVKIPYQAVVNDNNLKDNTPKRFEELKAQNDLVIILNNIYKLKCFFKCPLCNCSYATNDSNEFTKHMEAEHPPEKKLHCGYCLKEFSSPSLLTEHLLIEHSRRRYHTEVIECDPVTVPPNIEVKEESNEMLNYTWPYVCALGSCDFKTYDPKEFKSHNEMTHRSVSLFFCHYCKVDFLSVKRLLSHYRLHGINTYQCSYCIYGSEIRDGILLHVCNSHADYPLKAFMRGSEEDIPAEEKQLPYSLNSEVSRSNSVDSEELNVETDTNGVDFENQMYEVVGKTYYPKYTENICSHLVCGIPGCVEKFDNLLIYIGHLKNFHAAENFTCPHCSDVSETWEEFKNHLMCHGSALYACGLVTCNFYDWDKNIVTNHLNNHLKPTSKVVIVREPADITNDKSDVGKVKSLPESCPL